jgi:RimJ/RimL family protein N-acetyltransferase
MNDGLQPLELAHYARSMAGLIASWALERETQFAWAAHTFAFPVDGSALAAHVEVAQGRSTLVARRADDPPVAYVELVPDAANRSARVERLIVAPEQRRQGLGRSVLSLLVDTARAGGLHRLELVVATTNVPAIACYEAAGFVVEGTAREARFFDGTYRSMHLMAALVGQAGR